MPWNKAIFLRRYCENSIYSYVHFITAKIQVGTWKKANIYMKKFGTGKGKKACVAGSVQN